MSSKQNQIIKQRKTNNKLSNLKNIVKKKKKKNINNKIDSLSNYEIQNNSIYEEDDYSSRIYNKSISKDKIFFTEENKYDDNVNYIYNTISTFNYFKKRTYTNIYEYFNNNNNSIEINNNLSFSFGDKTNKNLLLDESPTSLNYDKNYNNLIKQISILNCITKKKYKKLKAKINNSNERNDKNLNNIIKKGKFSKKKKYNVNKNKNVLIPIHSRNNSEYIINMNRYNNKLMKIDKSDNISNEGKQINFDFNNKTISKNINFKMCDAYILSSNFEKDLTEKDKEMILRESIILNKSMKKININIRKSKSKSTLDNDLNNNNNSKIKIKNKSINYYNMKKNKNIKNINIKKDNNGIKEKIHKSKLEGNNGVHKIIRKRIVLEEEYMISPQGDKKLLSVKRIDNGNKSNLEKNNENILQYFKDNQNLNINNNSNNYRHSINNNTLYSSIFNNNMKQTEYNRTCLKSIDEDSQIISNISYSKNNNSNNSESIEEKSQNKNKNITTSHIKYINNKINNNIKKQDISNNNKTTHDQNINSESNKKELHHKKKLFYNKISIMKDKSINNFNKSSNNSSKNNRITSHTNFLNSNRTSMNFIEDTEKTKIDSSRGIYERISFTKEQPFMIYQDEENPNFIINNNRNCPNLVNIVFYNNDQKNNKYNNFEDNKEEKLKYSYNNKINIPQPKTTYRFKRSNYRFHEIKSISINKSFGSKSTRNHQNHDNNRVKNINYNKSYNDSNFKNNKKNINIIYSSMDNLNNNQKEYYEICDYDSDKNISRLYNNEEIFNKRATMLNKEASHYFIKYGNI